MNEEYKIPNNGINSIDLDNTPLIKKIEYLDSITKYDSSIQGKCTLDLIKAYREALKGRH